MNIKGFLYSLLLVAPMSFADTVSDTKTNSDQEIVATLIVLNNNEISVADLAPNKTSNKEVEDYAQLMKKEHTKNLDQTMAISKKQNIEPLNNQKATDLKEQGKQEVTSLTPLTKGDFDKKYINDMVKDHQNALVLLEGFLKQVNNPELKKHLLATKAHVEHHLEKAKEIQKQLS